MNQREILNIKQNLKDSWSHMIEEMAGKMIEQIAGDIILIDDNKPNFEEMLTCIKSDVDHGVKQAVQFKDQCVSDGLSIAAVEAEGYLRGMIDAKRMIDHICDLYGFNEPKSDTDDA